MTDWPTDILDGDNLCWDGLDGIEPWQPDDDYDDDPKLIAGACAYCGATEDIRENPEPFGRQQCCEACFSQIIGGERDDPPWRCGNALSGPSLSREESEPKSVTVGPEIDEP